MEQRRCPGCMELITEAVCPHCGYEQTKVNEPHQLPAGTVLRGQYEIGKVLGQGGFGITYLGWDLYLDAPVAVKEYFPSGVVNRDTTLSTQVESVSGSGEAQFRLNRERFLREAKTLARLSEVPEIVRVHNLFEENNTAYIIMEYIQGTDLRRYVRQQGGKLSPKETFAILRPVMEALTQVHQAELVHRDISPDNIMLLPDGTAKLLDFGAAREVADADVEKNLAQSTEAILKHGFAPMEQYQKKGNLGPWTDVYALCASMYYCMTGHVPPDAPGLLLGEVSLDWAGIPELTAHQAAVLEKGMATLPKDRIRTVEELCAALFGPETASAAETSPEEKPQPEPKKKKKAGILLLILGLLAAALLGGGFLAYRNYHIWTEATCEEAPRCTICGQTRGEAPGHSWTEADCVTAKSCTVCAAVEGTPQGHIWKEAACLTPKTCTVCGLKEGEARGHIWEAATIYAPETCSDCRATRGKPLERPLLDFWGTSYSEVYWSREFEFRLSTLEYQEDGIILGFTDQTREWIENTEMDVLDYRNDVADLSLFTIEWSGSRLSIRVKDTLPTGTYQLQFTGPANTARVYLIYGLENRPVLAEESYPGQYYFLYYTAFGLKSWKHEYNLVMSENTYVLSDTKPTTFGSQKKMFAVKTDAAGKIVLDYGTFFDTCEYWVCRSNEQVYTLSSGGWYLACDAAGTLYLTQELTDDCYWAHAGYTNYW